MLKRTLGCVCLSELCFSQSICPGVELLSHIVVPWWLNGKSVCLQGRRPGIDPWVRKVPWRRKWQPTPVLLPGKSHGRTEEPGRLYSIGVTKGRTGLSDSLLAVLFLVFLRNHHNIVLRRGCISYHCHQQCRRVPFSPHPLSIYCLVVDFF